MTYPLGTQVKDAFGHTGTVTNRRNAYSERYLIEWDTGLTSWWGKRTMAKWVTG